MGMANLQIVEAGKNVEAQYVEMMVPLYSFGCDKKIKKALANLKGIYSVNVDYHQQKVTVWGICDKYDVLTIVKNKRRGARFWSLEDDDNKIQFHESHSAPQSPQSTSSTKNAMSYFAKIKCLSLKLDMSMMKRESLKLDLIKRTSSLKLKSLKKAFIRSNSF